MKEQQLKPAHPILPQDARICVIGLGYVGLPLARLFSTKYPTVGFDLNSRRVKALRAGTDATREVDETLLAEAITTGRLRVTDNAAEIADCNFYVVAVPTPVDRDCKPDLSPLTGASATVATVLKRGDIVVYESTVYPGVTEQECVPVLERSGLRLNHDFFVGYSPERINPGDRRHTVESICKVTSGSTPEAAEVIDAVYSSVIAAGTHRASSIMVAEAAKVIENSQRDINIAFVNELSKIFSLMGIDTREVLEAASTKWNFLNFSPGLVGGHCIGVDPYYLAQCAQRLGYHPEIILAGRRMNDSMGRYVATETVRLMIRKGLKVLGGKVLLLGFTFKENCPDVRNTRVVDIYRTLRDFDLEVTVVDPLADPAVARREYDVEVLPEVPSGEKYDAVIAAVAHDAFREMDLRGLVGPEGVLYDVKGILPREAADGRL